MAAGTGENRALLYILYHRKKGMSFEESDHYWKTTHAKTALSIPIFTKNLTKYEQVHVDTASAHRWTESGFQVSDYDGIVVLEAKSEDLIREIFQDREYLERLKPDEEKFSERISFRMMPASVVTVLDKDRGIGV